MSGFGLNKNHIKSQDVIRVTGSIDLLEDNPSKHMPSTELLIEFLSSVMTKDYNTALKYCIEILNREPNNLTALEFYPLIVEKLEMIRNEELENTTSESSFTSTASSTSSSDSNSTDDEFLSPNSPVKWRGNYSSRTVDLSSEKINDKNVLDSLASTKETSNENTKTKDFDDSLYSKPKNNLKNLPKGGLNKKRRENETPLPSNLLIHATQTKTSIGSNFPRSEQEYQSQDVSAQQASSNILLHTTQTIILPNRPRDLTIATLARN